MNPTNYLDLEPRARRLAIVLSHPIQYYSPWFAYITAYSAIAIKVFYLWDFGVNARRDRGFDRDIVWDLPLLEGYEFEFCANRSRDPGTHRFSGLNNPDIVNRITAWAPDAVLLFGYAYRSHLRVLTSFRLRNVPLLMRGDSHDLCRRDDIAATLRRLFRGWAFQRFDAFLSVGVANARYLRNSGVREDRIFFAPHCVDNVRFRGLSDRSTAAEWRRGLGIDDDATVILFAGKFEKSKRPVDLLDAFKKLTTIRREGVSSKLVLLFVGSGELEPTLRASVGERFAGRVFFAPFQNQNSMPLVYASASVFVLPSFAPGETWGLSVNEAMSVGCPVVVSTHVGCGPDLVRHGETGWVFEAGSVEALAGVLGDALSDADRLRRVALAGQEHVGRYSYEAATEGLIAALRAVCKAPPTS